MRHTGAMIPIAQWETDPPDQVRTLRPEGVELGKMLAGFRHPVSFSTRKYVLGKERGGTSVRVAL